MNSGVSLSRNLQSSVSVYVVITYVIITLCCASGDGTFYSLSVALNVIALCQKLRKFVELSQSYA